MPNSLSSLLEQRAVREVADKTIAEFEGVVEKASQRLKEHDSERAKLVQEVADAQRVLATIRSALGRSTPLSETIVHGPHVKFNNYMFHLDSRSGGAGHFMKVVNGVLSCSCKAAKYGRNCWALRYIEYNLDRGRPLFVYYGSAEDFDSGVRPKTQYFRIPDASPTYYSKGRPFYGTSSAF